MQYLATLAMAMSLIFAAQAHSQVWVDAFNPNQVLTLNLEMNPADWDTIRMDTTNSIKVPAMFWADGDETQLLVSVRRKSSRALPSEANPIKVSLKIDINDYVSGQTWRSLTKLSAENGGDKDPISEGLAWNLHERATGEGFYPDGYHPGLAAWVRVVVNGQYIGLYTSVEQRDSQFLRNRGLPRGTAAGVRRSWLYEIDDLGARAFELEDGNLPHSPAWEALCYAPFTVGNKKIPPCPTPDDAALEAQLNELVDMSVMLTQGAVDAFSSNSDALFTHGKNHRHIDFNPVLPVNDGRKRLYLMWDLDAAISDVSANIYGQKKGNTIAQTPYQQVILNHPTFRTQYNAIMMGLLSGPLSESSLHDFLTSVESVVTPALVEDPYAGFGSELVVAEHFSNLRQWVSQRIINVLGQLN